MGMVKITSDSTADLEYLFAERGIDVLPLVVTLGDTSHYDGIDITPPDIFDYVAKTKILPKTAARSQEDYYTFFESRIGDCDGIVHFTISQSMSAGYAMACAAAESLGDVFVIDSQNLSTGIGLLVLYACELANQGKSAKEIYDAVCARRASVQASFVVDTMDYLYKGGRCSGVSKFAASLLRIKPMILVKNGAMVVGKKYMGSFDKVILKYVEDTLKLFPSPDLARIFITHTYADPAVVESVRKTILSIAPFREVIETKAGCTVTSHCGKNTLGILYINDGAPLDHA